MRAPINRLCCCRGLPKRLRAPSPRPCDPLRARRLPVQTRRASRRARARPAPRSRSTPLRCTLPLWSLDNWLGSAGETFGREIAANSWRFSSRVPSLIVGRGVAARMRYWLGICAETRHLPGKPGTRCRCRFFTCIGWPRRRAGRPTHSRAATLELKHPQEIAT